MPERDRYIAGVPCWADTNQPDPQSAVAFYSGLFGWECEEAMPSDAPGTYRIARIRGGDVAAITAMPEGAPPMAMWNTYIWVDNADETAEKVAAAGGTLLKEPFDVPEAGRMAVCADPDGAVFCVWQPGPHRGARIVNEHGSVNFNTLRTHNLERAREFYGAVLGWQTLKLRHGAELWTLPGYGDHLEQGRPGLREEMAAMGAPAGFEDVVAALEPIDDGQPDVRPHWGVTFAIDDAAAAAAKAAELGGTVLAQPCDVPWARITVIADPAGATFIASQFVIENRDLSPRSVPAVSAA